jgi:hypothetical protein
LQFRETRFRARRPTNSPFAKEVIERIGAVYAIEKKIRCLDAAQRRAPRGRPRQSR